MSQRDSKPTVSGLAKVMIENFIFMFLSTGAVGFTGSAVGIFTPQHDIYIFTLAFSTFWGFVGAAAAWSRTNEDIKTPKMFNSMMDAAGLSSRESKFYRLTLRVRKGFQRRLFVPFVHTPHCS